VAFAGLVGYGSFGSFFLTGLVVNFFLIDLLPPADRGRFGWTTWLVDAAPAGMALFAGATLALLLLFRPDTEPRGASPSAGSAWCGPSADCRVERPSRLAPSPSSWAGCCCNH
jgi:hypothetical protein